MISNIDSNYNAICKLFDFSKESTADINKKILLEMAKNGEDKPRYKTKLGMFFRYYTSKSSSSYDPVFVKLIKKLRPDWISSPSDIDFYKKELIELAVKDARPSQATKLGKKLTSYTAPSSSCFDEEFFKKINNLRPDWFVSQTQIANQNKKILLEMAKNGKNRPSQKIKMGIFLSSYTSKCSSSYDSNFTKKIRNLRPDWFVSLTQIANNKKKKLLEMAKNGEPKPKENTKLGSAFATYTRKYYSTFDKNFTKLIKKLRPDWFVTRSEVANNKKKKLLEMAKNKEDKPHYKTKLGSALCSYIYESSSSCDPIFTKQIRKLRPDWFKCIS